MKRITFIGRERSAPLGVNGSGRDPHLAFVIHGQSAKLDQTQVLKLHGQIEQWLALQQRTNAGRWTLTSE